MVKIFDFFTRRVYKEMAQETFPGILRLKVVG